MRKALGRGIDALITPTSEEGITSNGNGIVRIPISKIRPNRLQPRKAFDPEKLSQLAGSIKEHGLAQPILVSYDPQAESYELIAGERRLRACELAGLKEVEVVVRNPQGDKERLALALIENIQREDLNPIELAHAYVKLIKEFGINQTELGHFVGKSKVTISNTLRLLDLPEEVQRAIADGLLTEGHGRALLTAENKARILALAKKAVEEKLSVRELEALARQAPKQAEEEDILPKAVKPADVIAQEAALQHALGTKVEIRTRGTPTRGLIAIHYYSLDDFDRILRAIKK